MKRNIRTGAGIAGAVLAAVVCIFAADANANTQEKKDANTAVQMQETEEFDIEKEIGVKPSEVTVQEEDDGYTLEEKTYDLTEEQHEQLKEKMTEYNQNK